MALPLFSAVFIYKLAKVNMLGEMVVGQGGGWLIHQVPNSSPDIRCVLFDCLLFDGPYYIA